MNPMPTASTGTATAVTDFNVRMARLASSAQAAVVAVGLKSDGGRTRMEPAPMDDEEAMKGFWPGALLKLSDGSGGVTRYAYVPLKVVPYSFGLV
jgi:hypothetical protein